ncbi:TetR/AcrR family transcriptional regulator [Cryptosporangium aurantiacum]|uniref:TetR/AcrR family transcriptional regulator n=1 Tax=Cryptosporangium aurantiacum TaxID=134849 RepID=UPI001C49F211|nr:TetR/AcrR family transcriptional regulator [Cryptosporangium aurantiacum]
MTRVLETAAEIMLREGYAAVTSRSIAARLGIQPPLVHYYFPTVDDLFVALLRRVSELNVERLTAVMASDQPLRAWWDLASDPRGTGLLVEFLAAANHRPALKQEMGEVARQVRQMQMAALEKLLPEYGLDPDQFPPALIAATVQGLGLGIVADETAGYKTEHEQARAAVSRLIDRLEQQRASRHPD